MLQNPSSDLPISGEDRRLNRLLLGSMIMLDYALAFGEGRQTTLHTEYITQLLPTEEDIRPPSESSPSATSDADGVIRSPFPFAVKQMVAYGPLINMLNVESGHAAKADVHAARAAVIKLYSELPVDMQWNVKKWASFVVGLAFD